MPEIMSDEDFEDLVRATAKLRQIGLDEARKYLIGQGARTVSSASAESTVALGPAKPEQ